MNLCKYSLSCSPDFPCIYHERDWFKVLAKNAMNKEEFSCFLALLMCSDPWPVINDPSNQVVLEGFADRIAKACGYKDWLEAHHKL